jgi:hypothetical protein
MRTSSNSLLYSAIFVLLVLFFIIFSSCIKVVSNPQNQLPTSSDTVSQQSTRGTLGSQAPQLNYDNIWTGKWECDMGKFGKPSHKIITMLTQTGNKVSGTCDWENGKITATVAKTASYLLGSWSELPSYKPPDDAGDLEFILSADGNSFVGKWRYGSSGDWVGEWNGKRIR